MSEVFNLVLAIVVCLNSKEVISMIYTTTYTDRKEIINARDTLVTKVTITLKTTAQVVVPRFPGGMI